MSQVLYQKELLVGSQFEDIAQKAFENKFKDYQTLEDLSVFLYTYQQEIKKRYLQIKGEFLYREDMVDEEIIDEEVQIEWLENEIIQFQTKMQKFLYPKKEELEIQLDDLDSLNSTYEKVFNFYDNSIFINSECQQKLYKIEQQRIYQKLEKPSSTNKNSQKNDINQLLVELNSNLHRVLYNMMKIYKFEYAKPVEELSTFDLQQDLESIFVNIQQKFNDNNGYFTNVMEFSELTANNTILSLFEENFQQNCKNIEEVLKNIQEFKVSAHVVLKKEHQTTIGMILANQDQIDYYEQLINENQVMISEKKENIIKKKNIFDEELQKFVKTKQSYTDSIQKIEEFLAVFLEMYLNQDGGYKKLEMVKNMIQYQIYV